MENIDLRKSMPGWDKADFGDSAWRSVARVQGPTGKLVVQKEPPTRVIERFTVEGLKRNARTGAFRYKCWPQFQGWIQFRTSGPAGTTIKIGDSQFILGGQGVEEYAPRFNYGVISSVEIHGLAQPLEDMTGCHVNADLICS